MKKIAIIGASYLQLPLVRKAKEMGLEVHCFAWKKGAVCTHFADFFYPISVVDKEKILEICIPLGISGIISIASDIVVPTVCYVAEKLGLTSNSFESSFAQTNKFEMRKNFILNNVLSPRFVLTDEDYSTEGFKYPLIVKPTDRSGSLGVMKISSVNDLNVAVRRAKEKSFIKQAIVEEYIEGPEVSVETISFKGHHHIIAITDKVTTGDPHFVELEHHQPSLLSDETLKAIKIETFKALDALNVKYGASHSEFKVNSAGKAYVIEVGARMGGDFIGSDLIMLSTGYDFLKGSIEIALGVFEKPLLANNKSSGVCFLCKETEHLLPLIENHEDDNEIIRSERTDTKLHSAKCSADRSGYFIYQSEKRFIV